ncbi:methylaspartate mutase [Streptomyces sp. NPDC016640]|uniref:methylaspartate mutase n=1 Tax=Streptomyces sp. NPDC016640 TaxID=3364969 RepID=UPI0036F90890
MPDRRPGSADEPAPAGPALRGFGDFVRAHGGNGRLVVQPRMGFSDPAAMRAGLAATRAAAARTVGTITLDAHTRVGHLDAAAAALRTGTPLNGYPVVTHPPATTAQVLHGIRDTGFPVQVRHGSARPVGIFRALAALGLDASEGGPVSYCLPYGRTPLAESVTQWATACELFASLRETGREPHLETFGGCMLGQLCPPSMLVAISVLEALFFLRHGVRSLSVSYAQQSSPEQDAEAVGALRRLCAELLPTDDWHVVLYTYMGVFPETEHGARRLLASSAELAVRTGAERLIVKTVAESRRIPTIQENIDALELAAATARTAGRTAPLPSFQPADTPTYQEAAALVHAVLDLHPDLSRALLHAFRRGYLDVPYCLHPDNRGLTRSYIDPAGRLCWAATGNLPIAHLVRPRGGPRLTSATLLADLTHVRNRFDGLPPPAVASRTATTDRTVPARPSAADPVASSRPSGGGR